MKATSDLKLTSDDLLKEEGSMIKYKSLLYSALLNIQPFNIHFRFFYKSAFQTPAPISGCITSHSVLHTYKEQDYCVQVCFFPQAMHKGVGVHICVRHMCEHSSILTFLVCQWLGLCASNQETG